MPFDPPTVNKPCNAISAQDWPLCILPATLAEMRRILQPKRERYDFSFTMHRWAEIVWREETVGPVEDEDGKPIEVDDWLVAFACATDENGQPVEIEDWLMAHGRNLPPGAPIPKEDAAQTTGKGRPRKDKERWAALALGVIFYEYTKTKPTRIGKFHDRVHDTRSRDKSSPFYQFAEAAFKAIGLEPSEDAFRETTERDWPTDTEKQRVGKRKRASAQFFSKRAIRQLLWGCLSVKPGAAPDFVWKEKRIHPRKNSPPSESL